MSRHAKQFQSLLPGDWRLIKVTGWLPFGQNGRLIDTHGWAVMQPHVLAYANEADQIVRAEDLGQTARQAVEKFLRKFPDGNFPKAY